MSKMPDTRNAAPAMAVMVTSVRLGAIRNSKAQSTSRMPAMIKPQSCFFVMSIARSFCRPRFRRETILRLYRADGSRADVQ